MRLKQLLGVLVSLLVLTTMAAAAGTHLTAVKAQPQGAGTTITIQASGPFTHTEYRPADDSLLVDLPGVASGSVDAKLHNLDLPGVASYAVTSFKGASGAEVTRVEFHLKGAPSVSLADGADALTVNVTAGSQASAPASAPAAQLPPAPAPGGKPVTIENIGVVHGADGTSIEVRGTGVMTGKVLRLSQPDRIVLDLPNTILAARSRHIVVAADDLKDVRAARYQLSPPVTRIVLDLKDRRDWELSPAGNTLVLKMRAPAAAAATPQVAAPALQQASAPAAEPKAAQDFVMVQPAYQPKAESTEKAAAQPPADPVARAADAASKFNPSPSASDVPLVAGVVPMAHAAMGQQAQAAPMGAVNPAAQPQQAAAASAKRFTGEPISLNLKDADVVDFFRLIHEISGLNVVLDPNVKGRITLVLDDVPWDQALDIVLKNNGLDMQLEGNVLRIATVDTLRREADARRAQAEAQALAADKITVTRFLSYAHSKDVAPTIKKLLSQRGDVFSDDRTNALIIQDIPAVFPAIDRLLTQLDQKTQEVEIEARVVAATRNFARDIGTQMAFGWGNGVNTSVGGAATGTTPTTVALPGGGTPAYTTTSGAIPFFSNFGVPAATSGLGIVNATRTYRLDFYLTMAESRGLLKILSRPRVVTQNNIQALIKQGQRIPIVTSAQLGGPATTTYVDAFLRLTVTPQITAENTIFLNIDVENTVPDFGHVNNLGNPTLITQQATTQVLVTDGGTVVIGGVIQTQNSVSVFQVPLLGNIPVLGNLFKRRSVSSQTQELIFFITPKIIQT